LQPASAPHGYRGLGTDYGVLRTTPSPRGLVATGVPDLVRQGRKSLVLGSCEPGWGFQVWSRWRQTWSLELHWVERDVRSRRFIKAFCTVSTSQAAQKSLPHWPTPGFLPAPVPKTYELEIKPGMGVSISGGTRNIT